MKRIHSKRIVFVLFILVLAVFLPMVWSDFEEKKLQEKYMPVEEVISELQFTVYTGEEWREFFEHYIEDYMTKEMVSDILWKLGTADVISFEETGARQAVSREEWNQIYEQLLDYLDIENQIKKKEVLVLDWEEREDDSILYTNEGLILTEVPVSYFKEWEGYKIYIKNEVCIGVAEKSESELILQNAYITAVTERKLSFLFDERYYEKKANLSGVNTAEGVADISVQDSKIVLIGRKQDFIEGQLISYDDTMIEIEGYGRIAHSDRLPVYKAYDEVTELSVSDIILGNMDLKYIVGKDEVCAILITAPAEISKVRVLLLAKDGSKFRENVSLFCNKAAALDYGEETISIAEETVINVADYLTSKEKTLILRPESEDALTYLCNEKGEKISNGYSGNLELRLYDNGYCVVNEVDFETYLYSVVPSEMPSNYQPEALKAQAVCARSYAYIQVMRADLAAYGAHINDSTSYQVYNNIAKTEASIRAVDETAGMVMLYEGDVIEAYYYSTSMGYTDTVEVWNVADKTVCGYLKQTCLNYQAYDGDLSKEADFKAYLESGITGYDSDIKYYRWQIDADYSNASDTIKEILMTRRAAGKRHITYYQADGVTETDDMQGFGILKSMEVTERSSAGSILALMLYFENGQVKVQSEYNIRKVLGCGAKTIRYQDGSESACGSLLPSAACTVEKQADGSWLLRGGGYGHGLGMSQNGANGLAKAGYSYLDILNFFYKDIEVVDIRL